MRIVFVSYWPAYSYKTPDDWFLRVPFYHGILERLSEYAEIHDVMAIGTVAEASKKGVQYHFLRKNKWQLRLPLTLNLFIRKLKPDVVVVHGLLFPLQVILLRMVIGRSVKIVVQHHAEKPLKGIKELLQKRADKFIDRYLFTAYGLAEPWIKKGQIADPNKIVEVMEASSGFSIMDKTTARAFMGMEQGRSYLWVGNLDMNKDPLLVLRAFHKFAVIAADVKLYIIFKADELLSKVRKFILDNDLQKNVQLIGTVEHRRMEYWMNSADFIISTSHYESGGIAVCEAMSCGCIPILSDIPSFRAMTEGKCGIVYKAGDEEDLLNALKRSANMEATHERQKVLEQFNQQLSFKAIAAKIYSAICTEQA